MREALNSLLTADELERFLGHANGAVRHGLPGRLYNSEAIFAHELETLFRNHWVFVAFAHDLAEPGDAVPVTVGGKPVLLLRNKKGEIKAFHNVCRHRCLKLVDKPRNVGRLITCPYHAWAYGLDGELRSTPYFGGPESSRPDGFDMAQHGLVPVRSGVWHDWVFVNLSGTAPDFEAFVGPISELLRGLDFAKVKPVARLDFGEVGTNWKFLMENFIEPYHVQFVHKTTTEQPLLDHYTIDVEGCLGSAVDVTGDSHGADTLAVSSRYLTLFPNFILGRYFPDELGVYLQVPLSAGRTWQQRVIYTTEGRDLPPEEVEALRDLWFKVHKEDHAMCERLQEGRASEVADAGGVLSPHWESSVRRFQELVIDALR